MAALAHRIAVLPDEHQPEDLPFARGWPSAIVGLTAMIVVAISLEIFQPKIAHADPPPATIVKPIEKSSDETDDKLRIEGRCVDPEQRPLALVQVRLFEVDFASRKQSQLHSRRSNAKGEFRFDPITPGVGYTKRTTVFIVAANCAGRATMRQLLVSGGPKPAPDLALPPAGALKGRITNQVGQPIAGALVYDDFGLISPVPGLQCAVTDKDGQFEIGDFRIWRLTKKQPIPVGKGVITQEAGSVLQIEHPDFARRGMLYTQVPGTVDAVLEKPAHVRGRVVFAKDHTPARDLLISATPTRDGFTAAAQVVTDQQGQFELPSLRAGEYLFQAIGLNPPQVLESASFQVGANAIELRIQ